MGRSSNDQERLLALGALGVVAFGFMQQALKLQRTESDRRLSELNHHAERLQQAVSANVSSDTWQAFIGTYKEDQDRFAGVLQRFGAFQNKLLGALGLFAIIVPLMTALAVYLLTRHAVPVDITTNGR
jgi:hypothetical protein